MIQVKVKVNQAEINGELIEFNAPERSLTEEELKTVSSIYSDGINYYYYQGDEPK